MKPHSTPPPPALRKRLRQVIGNFPLSALLRWGGRLLLGLLAVWLVMLALLSAAWLFWLKPQLPQLKTELALEASRALGRTVSIGRLGASWDWLTPTLRVGAIRVANPDGSALEVGQVVLTPSWSTLWARSPRFSRIQVQGLELALTRERDGRLLLNGFALGQARQRDDGQLVNWLLAQDAIDVGARRLTWHDKLTGVPPLVVNAASLQLEDTLLGHRLRIEGKPDSRYLGRFMLAAQWRGDDINAWRSWQGDIRAQAHGGTFGWWERYLPALPLGRSGSANMDANLRFADGRVMAFTGQALVEQATLAQQRGETLALPRIAGRVDYQREGEHGNRLVADKLFLQTERGRLFDDSRISARWSDQGGGTLTASTLDLSPLLPILIASGVLPASPWQQAALSGDVSEVKVSWQGAPRHPSGYTVSGRFADLAWHTLGGLPGVAGGVNGTLALTQDGGELTLDGRDVKVDAPTLFAHPWQLTQADARLNWQRRAGGWQIAVPQLKLATEDFTGQIGGTLHWRADGALQSDLFADVPQVALTRVERYLPLALGADTLQWLRDAIRSGQGRNVHATLKGDLRAFPFPDGKGGAFRLDAALDQGALQFDPAWPAIDRIDGVLQLMNDTVSVRARSARSAGARLSQVSVVLPALATQDVRLEIEGQVAAPLPTMLAYTVASPVNGWLDGFLGEIRAQGEAALDLKLTVPLSGPAQPRVHGKLQLPGNALRFTGLPIPEVERAQGALVFTEYGVEIGALNLTVLGRPLTLSATSRADGASRFTLKGSADTQRLLAFYLPPLARYASGTSPIEVAFQLARGQLVRLQAQSTLVGSTFSAPAPAAKPASASWPLQLTLVPGKGGSTQIGWQLAGRAAGEVRLDRQDNLAVAVVAVGQPLPALPAQGMLVAINAPQLDADAWLAALPAGGGRGGRLPWPLTLQLDTAALQLGGAPLGAWHARARAQGNQVQAQLQGPLLAGAIHYRLDSAALDAHLTRLQLPLPDALALANAAPAAGPGASATVAWLRQAKLVVDRLNYKALELGRLNASLAEQGGVLRLQKLLLDSGDGTLTLAGVGLVPDDTRFRVAVASDNLGALLARYGMPGAVSGGKGSLNGELAWPGRLIDFSAEHVTGSLQLDVSAGRFASYDSNMARLLSVLSLQSVGKLLRLDFADIFDKGFAFDSIKGRITVQDGRFSTQNLLLRSTPATIALQGDVDLNRNTQNLTVTVTPRLSQGVALAAGAALLNPVAGIATLAAETLLGNPFDKVFRSVYRVSGPLSDPKVERVESALSRPR